MSRKHFTAIARAISEADMQQDARRTVALALAATLAQTNPAFDRHRFLAACGVQ